MDTFFLRLVTRAAVCWWFGVLALMCARDASADSYPVQWRALVAGTTYYGATAQDACAAPLQAGYGSGTYTLPAGSYPPGTPNRCTATRVPPTTQDVGYGPGMASISPEYSLFRNGCPYGGTVQGLQCINAPACTPPQVRLPSGACGAPPCAAGDTAQYRAFLGCYDTDGLDNGCDVGKLALPPPVVCSEGCMMTTGTIVACSSSGTESAIGCDWNATKTGASCGASTVPVASAQCPAGYDYGTVNGQGRCVAGTSTTSTSSTSTVTNPDGSQTSTTVVINNTTNTTTTTTTTTSAGGGGSQTQTQQAPTDPTKPMGDDESQNSKFCEDNPTHVMCQENKSSFSGSCGGFACDGDAIQCAIAEEQHRRNCALFDTATPLSTLGGQVASGADPLAGQLPSPSHPTVVDMEGRIDTSSRIASGCPSDLVTSWQGYSIVVPFSEYCAWLQIMGNIIVASAMFGALAIIGRA